MFHRTVVFLLAGFLSATAYAQIDYSKYDLTPKDIALCQRLEARGIAESVIVDYIEHLIAYRERPPMYIPPHTTKDLTILNSWAVGGAFSVFARQAGVTFDTARYWDDCPNKALFNFGLATATQYLNVDVTTSYTNMVYALGLALNRSPQTFHDEYMKQIAQTPFQKYLIPPVATD